MNRPRKEQGAPQADFDPSRVADDKCPVCPGELDTGWECNSCGFDARLIALTNGGTKQ